MACEWGLLTLTNWEDPPSNRTRSRHEWVPTIDGRPATVPHPNVPDRYAGGLNKLNQALLFVSFFGTFQGSRRQFMKLWVGLINIYVLDCFLGACQDRIRRYEVDFSDNFCQLKFQPDNFAVIGSKDIPVGSRDLEPPGLTNISTVDGSEIPKTTWDGAKTL